MATLLGAALAQVRDRFPADEWMGLRPSHFRVLEVIAEKSLRTVEIGVALGMTKQGAGQHVAYLADGGYVSVVDHPTDRRARNVALTDRGAEMLAQVDAQVAEIERAWSRRVGAADYAVFRRVLAELMEPEQ